MQLRKNWGYLIGAALLLLIIKYSESIFNGAKNIMSIMMPIIIGCAIAYVLNILVSKIESLPVFKNPNSKIYKFKSIYNFHYFSFKYTKFIIPINTKEINRRNKNFTKMN